MTLDLFAGIPVSDYEAAKPWYERLLGAEPSFIAHATEAVWELAEHRFLFIEEDAERAGGAAHTLFVEDLDARVADIASRGIEPNDRVTYPGKARKAIYRDADGNEIGFGGADDSGPRWTAPIRTAQVFAERAPDSAGDTRAAGGGTTRRRGRSRRGGRSGQGLRRATATSTGTTRLPRCSTRSITCRQTLMSTTAAGTPSHARSSAATAAIDPQLPP